MANPLMNILTSGIRDPLEPEKMVKLVSLNAIMILGGIMMGYFGVRDLVAGHLIEGIIVLAVFLLVFVILFLIRITRNVSIGSYAITSIAFLLFSYLNYAGANESSGVLWMTCYPIVALFLLGTGMGSLYAGAFFLVQVAFLFVPGLGHTEQPVEFKVRIAGVYIVITLFALALESIRSRTQKAIEEGRASLAKTTDQLLEEKARTDGILANVQEGIFLLDENLKIEPQYSRCLELVLGRAHLAGQPFLDLLQGRIPDKAHKAAEDYLGMFFQPDPNLTLLAEINPLDRVSLPDPERADFPEKHLIFSFTLVTLEKGASRLLATVRDITEEVILALRLKQEEDRAARQMKSLFQIIHVKPELMGQFLEDAQGEINEVNALLKGQDGDPDSLMVHLYQAVHAVKGNALLLGLKSFSDQAHDLEEKIASFQEKPFEWSNLLEITVGLSVVQTELDEIKGLIQRVSGFREEVSQGGEAWDDLLVLTLQKAAEKASADTGRTADLDAEAFQGEHVPPSLRKGVKDVLIQMVRNSLAHGIEDAGERRAVGKAERGSLSLASRLEEGKLLLTYRDDGQGLNESRLRARAKTLPPWKDKDLDSWPASRILGLIFHPGFSTAEQTDLTAGRGVGMGLIRSRLEALGGSLKILNNPGKGLAFEIQVPLQNR